ncbi:MAG: ABC transporter permease subunit [Kouleothrix sp.]|nr:ABC transporter permease subunit [Kouleothrix sp.]
MEATLAPPRPAGRVSRRAALRAVAIGAVFALALLLRVRAAYMLPADYDEDDYLRAGQLYAQHIAAGDIAGVADERENYEHPPLTKLAFGAVLALTQPPESYATPVEAGTGSTQTAPRVAAQARPLRIFGAVVGALTAGLVALVSPLAGLLVALNSWHIKYTSQAMLEALPCFFATLTLLMLRRSRRSGDGWWWAAAAALGVTAAGKYLYAAGGFAALIWMLWRGQQRTNNVQTFERSSARTFRLWPLVAAWGLVALLFFYAADPALWPDPVGRLRESIAFNIGYTTGAQVQQTGFGWAYQLAWLSGAVPWHPGIAPLLLDGLFALFAVLAWRGMWREERLVSIWFVVNLVFLLFWPTKWPQYVLALTVPISLGAAYWLRERVPGLPARARALRARIAGVRRFERGALLWLLPTLLLFGLIVLYPLLLQTGLAMTQFGVKNLRGGATGLWISVLRGLVGLPPAGANAPAYTGLGGLTSVFGWPDFPAVLRFNVLWVVVTMALATALGLWLATLLQRRGLRGRAAWRLLFILPWAFPEFVSALIFNTLFDDLFGPINTLTGRQTSWLDDTAPVLDVAGFVRPLVDRLAAWHLAPFSETLNFLASGLTATKGFWVLVLLSVWVSFPFMMLIGIAALRAVPAEVYDAARVDGAEGWTLWRAITWPLIRPTVLAGVLLRGILLFNAFHIPLMLVSDPQRPGVVTLAMVGYFVLRYDSDYTFAALINSVVLGLAIVLIWLYNRQTRVVEGVEYV